MSDKHLYDAKGSYVGRISDQAPRTKKIPLSVWSVVGVTIVWSLISAVSFPWGTLGFLIPVVMCAAYWFERSSSEVSLPDVIVSLLAIWCAGNLVVAGMRISS